MKNVKTHDQTIIQAQILKTNSVYTFSTMYLAILGTVLFHKEYFEI